MKQKYGVKQPRRRFLAQLMATGGALTLAACGQKSGGLRGGMSFRMGERATIGKLIYNVTELEYKNSLGDGVSARMPEHRFLLVKVSVTNSGAEQVTIPLLSVVNAEGKEYRELDNGEGVQGWMGFLRVINPAESRFGTLLFDVAPTSYKLQITDGGDTENEKLAYVDLPLKAEADETLSAPPALTPAK